MTNIRVIEKNGKNTGKTTVILAGIHGNEVCGVGAFDEIIPKIEIENGKVIFIYANIEAIKQNKRFVEKNLNRCFLREQPKEIKQSLEGKTAKEIIPYLEKADMMLDIHASFIENSKKFVICDESQIRYASIFDAEIASYNWDEFEPGSTDYYMNIQNKIGFGFECGYLGDIATTERAKKAVLNFLIFAGNIDGEIISRKNQKILRIKGLFKNKNAPFKKSRIFSDFEQVKEKTIIGYEGGDPIYIDKGDIVLFLIDNDKLNEECFLLAEETLINKENIDKLNEVKK